MKISYLFLCGFFFTLTLRADQTASGGDSLSLNDVTAAVLAGNPAVKAALARWKAARDRVPQEEAWDDPVVSANSRFARFVAIQPNAFMDQSVTLEQSIPISGKNRSRARVAIAEALSAFEEVRRQELDAVTKARSSYFRLASACAQIELNRRDLVSLKEIADVTRSKYSLGSRTAADVLAAETETGKLLEARRELERAVAAEQSQLNVLMNRDAFAALNPPEEEPVTMVLLQVERLRALTLADRPEIRTAQAMVDSQKAKLELAHREWIPDPSLTLEGQRYNDAAQAVSELDAGISFGIPWVNYRKYSSGVREAEENVAAAEQTLAGARKEAVGLLRDALQKADTARYDMELYRDKLLPQARAAFETSRNAYESGGGSFADWIAAQRSVRELEASARAHLCDYEAALAEVEMVVGSDLGLFPKSNRKGDHSR